MKGKGRFKGLLLAHGEKLGMALVAVCVLWLIYSGLGREKLAANRQPEQLSQNAQRAKQHIDETTYDQLPDEKKLSPVDYQPAAVMKPIELGKYTTQIPLNPPEFAPKIKRGDPQLLSVEELETHGGVGLLAMFDPNADPSGRGVVGRSTPGADGARRTTPKKGAKPPSRSNRSKTPRRGASRGGEGGYGGGARGGVGGDDGYSEDGPMAGRSMGPTQSLTEILPQGGVRVGASDKVEGHYWAVVLAKVPLTKQMELYRRAFRDAEFYQPQYDTPAYFGYVIERAEISSDGGPPQWKRVEVVSERKMMEMTKNWGGNEIPPLIDQRYYDPLLTFPLPPLVGRDWDSSMVALSDVPLATFGGMYEGNLDQQGEAGEDGKGEVDEHGFQKGPQGPNDGAGIRGGRGGRGGYGGGGEGDGYGGRGGYGEGGGVGGRPPARRGGAPGGGRQSGYGEERGGSDGYGGGGRMSRGSPMGMGRSRSPGRAQSRMPRSPRGGGGRGGYDEGGYGGGYGMQQEEIPFALFRFFDFKVEPGHRYQYRVQLALYDPNDQVEAKYLSDTVIKRREAKNPKYVLTGWSEPSPVVIIPFPGQLFAGPVKFVRPEQHYYEPTAKVVTKMLDNKEGVEGVAETEQMRRGKVANFRKSTEVIDYSGMRPTLRKIDNFTFLTNTMLVDIRGGEPLSKKDRELTEPGELLLLDPAGRLVVRTEMDDAEQYKQLSALLEAAKGQKNDRRGRTGAGEDRGGYGEGGRGGEGGGRGGYGEGGGRGGYGEGGGRGGRSSRGQPSRGRGRSG
jgi:hypothetical protein